MSSPDSGQPRILSFDAERRGVTDPNLAALLKDIVSSVKDLEQENKALGARNAELESALQDATEKLGQFESSTHASPETTRIALRMAAQMLERAGETADSLQKAAKADNADRYEAATRRALELQREATSQLERAREEASIRLREVDRQAIDLLRETRRSILSMAEDLDSRGCGASPVESSPMEKRPAGAEESSLESIKWPDSPQAQSAPETPREMVRQVAYQESYLGGSGPTARESLLATPSPAPSGLHLLTDSIELVASPFRSFATISAFHRAVRLLPGVVDVKAQTFDQGKLHLALQYYSPVPLVGPLLELPQFNMRLVSAEANRIEVQVKDNGR